MSYGTGAIMSVPGHDTRDWEFASKFNLPIIEVVAGGNVEKEPFLDIEKGVMVNSGILNGLEVKEAKVKIIKWLEDKGIGEKKVNYKLRTGYSQDRDTGESLFRWCIVTNAAGCRFPKMSSRCCFPRLKATSRMTRENHLLQTFPNGTLQPVRNAEARAGARQTQCRNGPDHPGTT